MEKTSHYISTQEQISLSTSLPSTAGRTKRNDKLLASYNKKQAKLQLQTISNRVQQLQKIKSLAEKEIEKLQSDIFTRQLSLKEKTENNERKRRFSMHNQELLEQRRLSNMRSREERKRNIKDYTEFLLKSKQKVVKEIREQVGKWEADITQERKSEHEERENICKKGKAGYVKALRNRCYYQKDYRDKLKDRYIRAIQEDKEEEAEAFDKIAELEHTEANLIDELSRTVEIKKSLRESLIRLRSSLS